MTSGWEGRHVVALGGAGQIGRWIVRDLLAHGASVVVPSRRPSALADLATFVDSTQGLLPVVTDVGTEAGARALAARLADEAITPVAAVAALGGWWEGERMVDLPLTSWDAFLASHLTSHFLAAKTLVPLLGGRPDPCYLTLNGIATHQPCVGSGPVCVTGAGQTMLLQMFEAENDRPGLRFHELSVLAPVNTDRGRSAEGEEVEAVEVTAVVRTILSPGYDPGDQRPAYPAVTG